jgi:agmatine/peptidylarginine deiminase
MRVEFLKHFAYIPTKTHNGKWIWLRHYYQKRVYWIEPGLIGSELQFAVIYVAKFIEEDAIMMKLKGETDEQ